MVCPVPAGTSNVRSLVPKARSAIEVDAASAGAVVSGLQPARVKNERMTAPDILRFMHNSCEVLVFEEWCEMDSWAKYSG
jgi:hypothetical protein